MRSFNRAHQMKQLVGRGAFRTHPAVYAIFADTGMERAYQQGSAEKQKLCRPWRSWQPIQAAPPRSIPDSDCMTASPKGTANVIHLGPALSAECCLARIRLCTMYTYSVEYKANLYPPTNARSIFISQLALGSPAWLSMHIGWNRRRPGPKHVDNSALTAHLQELERNSATPPSTAAS